MVTSELTAQITIDAQTVIPAEAGIQTNVTFEPQISVDTYVQIIGFLDEILADLPDNIANIEDMRAILMDELQTALTTESQ